MMGLMAPKGNKAKQKAKAKATPKSPDKKRKTPVEQEDECTDVVPSLNTGELKRFLAFIDYQKKRKNPDPELIKGAKNALDQYHRSTTTEKNTILETFSKDKTLKWSYDLVKQKTDHDHQNHNFTSGWVTR